MALFMNFEAFGMLPGINAVDETVVNSITWGPWEHNRAFVVPTLLDGAARDAGSSPTDLLRPGLFMGVTTATKQATTWVSGGGGGVGTLFGILLYDVKVTASGTDYDRWFGFILVGGNVKTKSIIEGIGGSTPGSWIGGAHDAAMRALLTPRFILDDQWYV